MTLIEVMIAITLLGFIMIGVVTITDNSRGAKERTALVDQDNLAAEAAMARLEADFAQIWSPLYFTQKFTGSFDPNTNPEILETVYLYERHPRLRLPSKEGLPIPIFRSKEKTEFVFLTSSNRRRLENQKQSQFMWVRYYLGDPPAGDPDAPGSDVKPGATKALLRQVFSDDPWSKEELDFEDTRSAVLLENVEKMEFKFWSPQTKKWESSLTALPDGEHLQRGLQIALTWYDSQGHKRETVRSMRPLWPAVTPQDAAAAGGANSGLSNGGGTPAGSAAGGNGGLGPDGLPLNDESEP